MSELLLHTFDPVYDRDSAILILGTFPSVKSREQGFYYAHAQNRFWRVTARLTGEEEPRSVEEKKALLHRHGIALWDVAAACRVKGSSDSSLKSVSPNDVGALLAQTGIRRLFANGRTAKKLYDRLIYGSTGVAIEALPSTSPANAAFGLDELCREWSVIVPLIR